MTSNFFACNDKYVVMLKTLQYYCTNYQALVSVDALEAQIQHLPGVVSMTSLAASLKSCRFSVSANMEMRRVAAGKWPHPKR